MREKRNEVPGALETPQSQAGWTGGTLKVGLEQQHRGKQVQRRRSEPKEQRGAAAGSQRGQLASTDSVLQTKPLLGAEARGRAFVQDILSTTSLLAGLHRYFPVR